MILGSAFAVTQAVQACN